MKRIWLFRIPLLISLGFESFRLCALLFAGLRFEEFDFNTTVGILLLALNLIYILCLVSAVTTGDGIVTILILIIGVVNENIPGLAFDIVDLSLCIFLLAFLVWLETMRLKENNRNHEMSSTQIELFQRSNVVVIPIQYTTTSSRREQR